MNTPLQLQKMYIYIECCVDRRLGIKVVTRTEELELKSSPGGLGCRIGESSRLPAMWPTFNS